MLLQAYRLEQIGQAFTMMAWGFLIDMDLGFFKGNGLAVTSTPLDIMLMFFARPSAHNTLPKIWNFNTFN